MIAVVVALLIYGYVHSLLASQELKSFFRQRLGERAFLGFYRLGYNIFAIVSIVPVWALYTFRPGDTIWSIDLRWEPVLFIIQLIGQIGLVISLLQIDLGRFSGLTQVWAYFTGGELPLPEERLKTGGLYAIVRHPLYIFALMTIWPVTTMTQAYLGFCIGATAYFLIGSIYEEKRMVTYYGDEYQQYREKVRWMLPLPKFSNKS